MVYTINHSCHSDFPLPNFGREPLQGQRQLNLTAGRWRWPTPRGQHGDAEVDAQILTELMDPMGKPPWFSKEISDFCYEVCL